MSEPEPFVEPVADVGVPPAQPARRRGWLQFGLRHAMIFVILFCVVLAWFGTKQRRYLRQQEAIERFRGSTDMCVYYDYQFYSDPDGERAPFPAKDSSAEPPGSKWGRRLLGEYYFTDPAWLLLSEVDCFRGYGTGRKYNLHDPSQLPECTLPVEDQKLLERFTTLTLLSIQNHVLADAGMRHIGNLTNLQYLTLDGSFFPEDSLRHLERLKNLHSLYLVDTPCRNQDLYSLRGLGELRYLRLSGTGISDEGLEYLESFRYLEYLWLDKTAVSDAGLTQLRGLHSLRYLILDNTKVTQAGIAELQPYLPQCRIDWDEPPED